MKKLHLLLLLFPALTFSQSALTLREAMDVALRNNYDLQLARNDAEAARIANAPGASGNLPSVSMNARDRQSTIDLQQQFSNGTEIERKGTASNSLAADLTVNYTLFNGLKIRATRARLEALSQIGEQQLMLRMQNTLSDVTMLYFDIVRKQRYRSALERGREFADQKLKILQQRQQVGLSNNADVFQGKIDLNASDQRLADQRLQIRRSEVDLAVFLGLSPDTTFLLPDTMVIDTTITLQSALSKLSAYPELVSAAAATTVSEQYVREIRSQRLPSLRLDGGYSYGRTENSAGFSLLNQFNGPSVGATLQVPLFNGGIYQNEERIAKLRSASFKTEESMTRQRVEGQVIKAYEAYRIALGQLHQQDESLSMATQLLDIQLLRFSNGQSTILDLKAAQSAFEEAAAGQVNARFVAKIAETELKRLMGALASGN
jgi:outer membrane protein TolC